VSIVASGRVADPPTGGPPAARNFPGRARRQTNMTADATQGIHFLIAKLLARLLLRLCQSTPCTLNSAPYP